MSMDKITCFSLVMLEKNMSNNMSTSATSVNNVPHSEVFTQNYKKNENKYLGKKDTIDISSEGRDLVKNAQDTVTSSNNTINTETSKNINNTTAEANFSPDKILPEITVSDETEEIQNVVASKTFNSGTTVSVHTVAYAEGEEKSNAGCT